MTRTEAKNTVCGWKDKKHQKIHFKKEDLKEIREIQTILIIIININELNTLVRDENS